MSRSIALAALVGLVAIGVASPSDAGPKPKTHAAPKKKRAQKKDAKKVDAKPAPLPPAPEGAQVDFDYDGSDVGHAERAWFGRAFVPASAAKIQKPLPVFVFLHGTNNEAIKYRWIGAGTEGDVRRMVTDLIDAGKVAPMIIAAPSQIKPESTVNAVTSWPSFDLDHFLDQAQKKLGSTATIDRSRVVVAGHSGGACNAHGGVATAMRAKAGVLAAFLIDGCMLDDMAGEAANGPPKTSVIITWQSQSWDNRPFGEFTTAFTRAVKKNPPPTGVYRELDYQHVKEPRPHDAMVKITLEKWLPRFVPAG